jgi:hypothetical protein
VRPDRFDLPLRIVVVDPAPGFGLALQKGATGKAAHLPAAASSPTAVAFDLEVTVQGALADGRPRFLGPFVHGPPAERFVYICVAQIGGAPVGRMKIPLGALDWAAIEGLPPGQRIEGRVSGRGRRGGPAFATVPILEPGWVYGPGNT